MNKTIIININGIVFHIEEDAYEILKNYMTDVKRHFLNSADSLEITTDIENRIAEMFTEMLLKENKQVIVEQDVKQVVEQMGTVEDFEHAEEGTTATPHDYNYKSGTRTLFRDPDDHLLGGVCAGLANYFDIRAIWLRLAFALTVAFFGTGFILYIILWIVIPKAATRADRMAMKGEKLNLQGFKNSLEEELSAVRQNLSNMHREAKPAIYKVRDFADDLFYHMGRFFRGAGKVLVKLLGIFILLSCLAGVIAMIVLFAAAVVFGKEPNGVFPFSIIDSHFSTIIYSAAFITGLLPVVAIALLTISAVFNIPTIGKSSGSIVLVVWLFALGTLIFYVSRVLADFRSSASFSQTTMLKAPTTNKYYLNLNEVKYLTSEDSARLDIKHLNNVIVTNEYDNNNDYEDYEENHISIRIEKSDVTQPVLVQSFRARGKSYDDALYNARNTHYTFTQQDTVLKFDRRIQRLNGATWHDQQVDLILKVPMNAEVIIDDKLRGMIDGVDIYACKEVNKKEDAPSATFIMTANGLECKVDTLVTVPAVIATDSAKTLKAKPVKVK
jgi:phage shock protein PspC (stress-responsive transcriptional regulator)